RRGCRCRAATAMTARGHSRPRRGQAKRKNNFHSALAEGVELDANSLRVSQRNSANASVGRADNLVQRAKRPARSLSPNRYGWRRQRTRKAVLIGGEDEFAELPGPAPGYAGGLSFLILRAIDPQPT